MAKIKCGFGGGSSTVLYSAKSKRFYDYEMDREELHKNYGGLAYYTSMSGLSGAGFLNPSPEKNDLIVFGSYRTDAGFGHQHREVVGIWQGAPIFGYVPTASHAGITPGFPVVLTDGDAVVFSLPDLITDALKSWAEIREKAIQIVDSVWMAPNGGNPYETSLYWRLYNPAHLQGVNALRFVDTRSFTSAVDYVGLQNSEPTFTCGKLGLWEVTDGDGDQIWLHKNPIGFFDRRYIVSPNEIVGELGFDGWIGDGNGLIWRRCGTQIEAFIEVSWETTGIEPDSERPAWVEFEKRYSVLEWFNMDSAVRATDLMAGAIEKARQIRENLIQNRVWREAEALARIPKISLKENMGKYPLCVLTLEDSYKAGNCHPGTARFVEEFGLPETGISFGDILAHPRVDRMLDNPAFLRVVEKKLMALGVTVQDPHQDEELLADEDLL